MKNTPPSPMPDRRDEERYKVTLDVLWQGTNGRFEGTISDVNWSGCFILTGEPVSKGEVVHVFLPVHGGARVQITGTVTNVSEEIGFGLKFEQLNDTQWGALESLISGSRQA